MKRYLLLAIVALISATTAVSADWDSGWFDTPYYDQILAKQAYLINLEETAPNPYGYFLPESLGGLPGGIGSFVYFTGESYTWYNPTETESFTYIETLFSPYFVGTSKNATGNASFGAGLFSSAAGTASTAVGFSSRAEGAGSVAIGESSLAQSTGSIAIGQNATAVSDNSVAIGAGAYALSSVAIGGGAQATGSNTTAVGDNAIASGDYAVALGNGAQATHNNSVALGNGSATSAPNTVSVGVPGAERRIENVADGIADTDAVNVRQLKSIESDNRNLRSDLNETRKDAFRGIAQVAALMPLSPDGPGRTTVNVGVATYKGQSGFGISASHQIGSAVVINIGVGLSSGSSSVARGGIGFRF